MSYMRCHKCDERAVIRLNHHRLNLCKEHYIEWFQRQTQRTIDKWKMFTHDDRVMVAVSGGKDSLALWDVLLDLGYNADGFYIGLGIDGGIDYSDRSYHMIRKFVEHREANGEKLNLRVIKVKPTYGASIPELAKSSTRGKDKPCSVCGIVKRHIMNTVTIEGDYTAVATGHNLDDEAAVLFGNTLRWDTEMMVRQSPVLKARNGMPQKVKPFFRFYERETAVYTLLRGIDYMYEECPFAEGSRTIHIKHLLNQLEDQSVGAKLAFYMNFLNASESGFFNANESKEAIDNLHACPQCGQPTSARDLCAFCRLFE